MNVNLTNDSVTTFAVTIHDDYVSVNTVMTSKLIDVFHGSRYNDVTLNVIPAESVCALFQQFWGGKAYRNLLHAEQYAREVRGLYFFDFNVPNYVRSFRRAAMLGEIFA